MALSGSRDFVATCDELIETAMDLVGTLNQGNASLEADKADNRRLLNMVVQSISARGVLQLWTQARRTALYVSDVVQNVVTSGTSTYDLATDVLDVLPDTIFVRPSGGSDQRITVMSYEDYAKEGSKSQSGRPTRVLIEKNQTFSSGGRTLSGRLRFVFHPVPNNSTDVIGYTAIVRLQDFDAQTNDPDAPPVFMRCLAYGLAAELAIKYGLPISERGYLKGEFEAELDRMRHHDTMRGSMRFTPVFPGGW